MSTSRLKELNAAFPKPMYQYPARTPVKFVDTAPEPTILERTIILEAVNVLPGIHGRPAKWAGGKSILTQALDALKQYNEFRFLIPFPKETLLSEVKNVASAPMGRAVYNRVRYGLYRAAEHLNVKITIYRRGAYVYFRFLGR